MTVFEVLAEPRRREILDLLCEGERTVGEIVDRVRISQPGVSKHLRVLRDAGLVGSRGAAGGGRRMARAIPAPVGGPPGRT